MSGRLQSVLKTLNCRRLGDLAGLTYEHILKTQDCGAKTLAELRWFIDRLQVSDASVLKSALELVPALQAKPVFFFIPPEARSLSLETLPVTRRLAAALETAGFQTLGDLHGIGISRVRTVLKSGSRAYQEFHALVAAVQKKWFTSAQSGSEGAAASGLVSFVDGAWDLLPDRDRELLELRLGAEGGEALTLQQIGDQYGVTRERIRQLQDRALDRLSNAAEPFVSVLLQDVSQRCLSAVTPLTTGLLDGWLKTQEVSHRFPLAFYIRLLRMWNEDIPDWPQGQEPSQRTRGRSAEVVRSVKKTLKGNPDGLTLPVVFVRLQQTGVPAGLTALELLETLKRSPLLRVNTDDPCAPTVRVLTAVQVAV